MPLSHFAHTRLYPTAWLYPRTLNLKASSYAAILKNGAGSGGARTRVQREPPARVLLGSTPAPSSSRIKVSDPKKVCGDLSDVSVPHVHQTLYLNSYGLSRTIFGNYPLDSLNIRPNPYEIFMLLCKSYVFMTKTRSREIETFDSTVRYFARCPQFLVLRCFLPRL